MLGSLEPEMNIWPLAGMLCVAAQLTHCTKVPGPLGSRGGCGLKFNQSSAHKPRSCAWLHLHRGALYWPSHIHKAAANHRGKLITNRAKPVHGLAGDWTQTSKAARKTDITVEHSSTEVEASTKGQVTLGRGSLATHFAKFGLD